MSTTVIRQPASATASASSTSQLTTVPPSSNIDNPSALPPPPSYSYSIGAASYQGSISSSSELPTSYAPNPNVRLDFAFHQPSAAFTGSYLAPSSSVSSSLPSSYAPSVSPALVASVAPSVRIYPAFNVLYKPSMQEQQVAASSATAVASQLGPPQLAHAASVPVFISYPNVTSSAQPVHSTYSYVPSSHMYPLVVSPSAPTPTAAFSAPVSSCIHRAASLPSFASSPALPAAEMSSSESVHLANFQARVSEERWLMAEQREAESRRKRLDANREQARVRRERNPSISASFSQAFGGLFSPLKKRGSSGSSPSPSSNSNKGKSRLVDSMKGLSLDSKPPSKVISDPPAAQTSPLHHKHLLTDQFIRNENDPSQKLVRHLVVPTDDLVDLALRYDSTVEAIRRHNRRVVFQHLDNVHNEYIHIPVNDSFQLPVVSAALASALSASEDEKRNEDYVVPGAGGLTAEELRVQSEMNRQFYAVRSFLSQVARRRTAAAGTGRAFIGEDGEAVADCTEQEAEFYLQEASYNVNLAMAAYMEDLEWEARDRDDKKRRQQATAAAPALASGGQSSGAGKGAKKPYSSLALALAEAKQQRLAAISRDANAAQRRDEWMARKLKKRYNLQQHGQMAAPLLYDADADAQQPVQHRAALSDDRKADYEQSGSPGPAFRSYANSPSVAS